MSHINLYDKKLNDYSKWINKLETLLNKIEENILQNDNSSKIEEKVISIGISSLFVSIGSGIVAFFGIVAIGFTGGLALFSVGWIASKGINRKVFGSERKIENINEEEKELLVQIDKVKTFFNPIRKKIKIKKLKKQVAFTNYSEILRTIKSFSFYLNNYDSSELAYKYKIRHSSVVQEYVIQINKFNEIYSHKKVL